jgi:Zn-dependent M28 family amino/carboxypeptidase
MRSFDLKTKLSFKGEFKRRDFVASNVIGLIEGSDEELRDSYIIVSAHYDHLGIGEAVKGDSIYNGVFDNAAGTAAVLELAKVFASKSIRTKRSIIFLLLTGEEKGLLGSIYYTDHPIKPLYKTIANINIDGVASFDIFKSIVAVGSEYSTLKNNIEHSAEKMNLSIVPIPSQFVESESFNRSDQIAFANAGIPSVLVLDAPDYVNISKTDAIEKFIYYNQNVYHTPFDDLQQPINYDAVNQHLELLFDIIYSLANSESEPEWNSGAPFINARLRSKAEKK